MKYKVWCSYLDNYSAKIPHNIEADNPVLAAIIYAKRVNSPEEWGARTKK